MRHSKKCMTGLLPTFLALMSALLVACSATNQTTPGITTKASSNKQVLILPEAGFPGWS